MDQEIEQRPALIHEVEPIERSRSEMIKTRGEIKDLVESPLVEACEKLWDLNILTLASSANLKDIGSSAYLVLDFDSLSDQNKEIAKEKGQLIKDFDGKPAVKIDYPVSGSTTTEEITGRFNAVSESFQKQKATWIPSYSLADLRQMYTFDSEDQSLSIEDFIEEGYYFDQDKGLFYLSEEHFRKATEA